MPTAAFYKQLLCNCMRDSQILAFSVPWSANFWLSESPTCFLQRKTRKSTSCHLASPVLIDRGGGQCVWARAHAYSSSATGGPC